MSRRAVPLHWSSLFAAVTLACLVVVSVTGAVLLVHYDPSARIMPYSGSYSLLQGVPVSRAYASTLHISFEVPGGLLVRQVHHWAALVLPASLALQLLATFFSGGFRRPGQWAWVLLVGTYLLVLVGGWSGYALPDDLLAGTGLRIVEGLLLGIPVLGSRLSFLLFGGEFPGTAVTHLYWLHVAVVPALLVGVLLARGWLALRGHPPQHRAPGRTETNVVGLPRAAYAVRATGLFLVTAGVLVALGGLVAVNPVWLYGPAAADHASAGSQPDWYTDFLDGALRLSPGWEVRAFGHDGSIALVLPQLAVGLFLSLVLLWPFLEERVTRDRAPHHLLDRPREHPVRTALGVSGLTFYCTLWLAGASDLVTLHFDVAFEHQVVALRTLALLGPLVAFPITRQICLGLVERERDELSEGIETGVITRDVSGGYTEVHRPPALGRSDTARQLR